MTYAGRFVVRLLLITLVWTILISASDTSHRCRKRHCRQRHSSPPPPRASSDDKPPQRFKYVRKPAASAAAPSALDKRGIPGIPGDIEWMGFYGSLLAIPTMLSVLGIVTNYNLEKSYFNSQLNAQYYKQSREMLRAHSAKLIREQEQKFAQAGYQWNGMVYDKDGNVRPGAQAPSWHGTVIGAPLQAAAQPGASAVQPAANAAPPRVSSPPANPGAGTAVTPGSGGAIAPGSGGAITPGSGGTVTQGGSGTTSSPGGSGATTSTDGTTTAGGSSTAPRTDGDSGSADEGGLLEGEGSRQAGDGGSDPKSDADDGGSDDK
ncbi:uncharacterized protein SRS1_12760 [Sporisorium reilianum f. sp. reilianum]|uniref:Transmembrane protein n=1 Tax=Sporisorium reilianum f. sp. reilianum TaxID=72559 RepID=A0A2N8U9Q7_9BASI|nr:uncharacterized protein SRS1_12760 [Sporisorium reilianum f. sp. reilianum]